MVRYRIPQLFAVEFKIASELQSSANAVYFRFLRYLLFELIRFVRNQF